MRIFSYEFCVAKLKEIIVAALHGGKEKKCSLMAVIV
jgi:hypothetical protein